MALSSMTLNKQNNFKFISEVTYIYVFSFVQMIHNLAVVEQQSKSLMLPLLKIPLVLIMIFAIFSGMASMTFLDVGLAIRLHKIVSLW